MENRPIIAFDFASKQEIETFLTHFPISEKLFVKIGWNFFIKKDQQSLIFYVVKDMTFSLI